MNCWQITNKEKIEIINKTESLNQLDDVKVKITKALLTSEDVATFIGEDKRVTYPIIPCRKALGIVVELNEDNLELQKNTRVYISPIEACQECYNCVNDNPQKCYDFKIAGKTVDGFLKDFVVKKSSELYALPPSVKDEDAIFIDYIALSLNIIDSMNLDKGQHVAIVGGNVFACILAQLIIYYQGVPILIDNDEENLELAKKSGIYYTLSTDNDNLEKEIANITGGRMVSRAVNIARSSHVSDICFNIASPYAQIVFTGFTYTNMKISFNTAMQKQLKTISITNGYGNIETAINLLNNKAVDLTNYRLPLTSMEKIEESFNNMAKCRQDGVKYKNVLIDMIG